MLDLVADDRDAALVGGVELQDTALQLGGMPQRPAEGQGDGGLAGAGRTVKQEVGKAVRLDGILEGRHHLGLMRDVGKIFGAVLLYPRRCRDGAGGLLNSYHGCMSFCRADDDTSSYVRAMSSGCGGLRESSLVELARQASKQAPPRHRKNWLDFSRERRERY